MDESNTIQGKYYTQLSLTEREKIAIVLAQGQSLRSIARSLRRSPSFSFFIFIWLSLWFYMPVCGKTNGE
jgi:hypothetical protein